MKTIRMTRYLVLGMVVGLCGCPSHSEPTAAPKPPTPSSAARDVPSSATVIGPWTLVDSNNPISGETTWALANIAQRGGVMVIYVRCARVPGKYALSLFDDGLYPGIDPPGYRVSYRVDDKPGVENRYWDGEDHVAFMPDDTKLIPSLVGAQRLIVQVQSSMMPIGGDASNFQYFDVSGFSGGLAKLEPHCVDQRGNSNG